MNNLTGTTIQQLTSILLINDEIIRSFINNWCLPHLREDFYQDLMVILYGYNKNKLQTYINNNLIMYLIIKIIKNNLKGNTKTGAHKNFLDKYNPTKCIQSSLATINGKIIEVNFTDDYEKEKVKEEEKREKEINDSKKIKEIERIIAEEINKNKKFILCKILWEMKYKEGKTYRQIHKKTQIPITSVFLYIKKVNDLINNNKKLT